MRGAIFETFGGPLTVRELPEPACPEDGVVVEVRACGVCRSDWHGWRGADPDVGVPHVPGHEFSGVVLETGPGCRRFHRGDRVTAPFILACGTCTECVGGDPTVCPDQYVVGFSGWGAFAERVPIARADFNLVRLPDALDFVTAAALGCRVTTAFRALTDRGRLGAGEWLAVHGCGGAGLSAVMLGAALGATVLAVDVNEEALALARRLGATDTLLASAERVGDRIRERTGGGVHLSIDALGTTQSFENSLRGLRSLGRHVQIGMPLGAHARPRLALLELVYARQITVMGTRGIAASRFRPLLEMARAGRIDPADLVTRRIALSEVQPVFEAMSAYAMAGIAVIDGF